MNKIELSDIMETVNKSKELTNIKDSNKLSFLCYHK